MTAPVEGNCSNNSLDLNFAMRSMELAFSSIPLLAIAAVTSKLVTEIFKFATSSESSDIRQCRAQQLTITHCAVVAVVLVTAIAISVLVLPKILALGLAKQVLGIGMLGFVTYLSLAAIHQAADSEARKLNTIRANS